MIAKELELPDGLRGMISERQQWLKDTGETLVTTYFPEPGAASVPR